MNKTSFFVFGMLVAVGIFGFNTQVQAYEAKSISLSPNLTLFVTTYDETLLNRDGLFPISASMGAKGTYEPLAASYQVAGKSKIAFTGKSLGGFILSNQPIQDGGYAVAEGEKVVLMLVTLISHDKPLASDVRATLTSLPILITENQKVVGQTIKGY